jgi:hypothetical protein
MAWEAYELSCPGTWFSDSVEGGKVANVEQHEALLSVGVALGGLALGGRLFE